MKNKIVSLEMQQKSGKDQLEYYLNNPNELPIVYYAIFDQIGLGNMLDYLNNLSPEEFLNLVVPKSIDLLYFHMVKNMDAQEAVVFICNNQINIECLIENKHICQWLSNLKKNQAFEILKKYGEYDSWIAKTIFSGSTFSNKELITLLLKKDYRMLISENHQVFAWNLNDIFKAKGFSFKECMKIFHTCPDTTCISLLCDEIFQEEGSCSYLCICLIKEAGHLAE